MPFISFHPSYLSLQAWVLWVQASHQKTQPTRKRESKMGLHRSQSPTMLTCWLRCKSESGFRHEGQTRHFIFPPRKKAVSSDIGKDQRSREEAWLFPSPHVCTLHTFPYAKFQSCLSGAWNRMDVHYGKVVQQARVRNPTFERAHYSELLGF